MEKIKVTIGYNIIGQNTVLRRRFTVCKWDITLSTMIFHCVSNPNVLMEYDIVKSSNYMDLEQDLGTLELPIL
jgi:hypothetical protein